ncbi:MAG: hypothetical protein HZA59_04550 [Hydrogenophilales bacterium]|nr:hypothetical protein [Hydrogenophilales bacterium]
MHPRYFVFILALLLHAGAATADTKIASEPIVYQPLAAHYQESRRVAGAHQESADWYFTRRDNQIESAHGDYAEVWQRDERGQLTLTRVFHQDRKMIQYTPGELRTQGRHKDWATLNSIIDPRQLTTLKRVGAMHFLGRPASRYTGTLGGEKIEVLWLANEALAAKLVRSGRDGSVSLELKELRASPDSRWPQANLARADKYAFLDGADLGDMEYDPFVQRVLGVDGGHGAHAHHAH